MAKPKHEPLPPMAWAAIERLQGLNGGPTEQDLQFQEALEMEYEQGYKDALKQMASGTPWPSATPIAV